MLCRSGDTSSAAVQQSQLEYRLYADGGFQNVGCLRNDDNVGIDVQVSTRFLPKGKYIVNHYGPPCLFNRLIFSSAKRPFKYHLQHISWDDYPSRNNLTSQVPSARWQRNVEREADDNRSDQTIWASNLHSWQKSFIWCH
jgi:hypothetical protein